MVPSPNARTLARRLIDQEQARRSDSGSPDRVRLDVCRRLNVLLSRTIGSIGASTLFTRALRAAEAEAPVLAGLSLGSGEEPFEHVDEVRTEHGAQALAAALEAFLEILLALLSRFIGDDIVAALAEVDHDPTDEAHGDEKELA